MSWSIFYMSLIPAVLWILYFYFQDRYEKEPFKIILITFVLGTLSIFPALLIELPAEAFINYVLPFSPVRILISMLMVGLAEEISKFMAVYYYAYKQKDFNEPMDGIVYSVTAAMGFAFIENIGYMFKFNMAMGALGAYSIGVVRGIFSMFGHASFAVVAGSYMGRAKFDKKNEKIILAKGILLAALLHTLYNFTLQLNKGIVMGLLILISFVIVWRNLNRVQIDTAEEGSPFKPEEEKYEFKRWRWSAANVIALLILLGVLAAEILLFDQPKTFINNKMNYKIKHPPFWQRRLSKNFAILELRGPSYQGSSPVVRVEIKEADSQTVSYLLEEFLKELSTKRQGLQKVDTHEIVVQDHRGIMAKIKWKGGKNGRKAMMSYVVVIPDPPRIFRIQMDTCEKNFGDTQRTFEKIIKSIEFIKE